MRLLLGTVVLICLSLPTAYAEDSEKAEAVSYFDAVAANWAGLRNFDVLLTKSTFVAFVGGRTSDIFSRYRLIADYDKNRFLFIYSGSQDEGVADELVTKRGLKAFSFDLDSRQAWMMALADGGVERLKVDSDEAHYVCRALAISGFPEIRFIGTYQFPQPAFSKFTVDEAFKGSFNLSKDMHLVPTDDGVVRVQVDRMINEKTKNVRFRAVYHFDAENLAPVSLMHAFVDDDGRHVRTLRKESYKWKEINGVVLPKVVETESVERKQAENIFPETTVATFHWLSVNEEIDPKILDVSLLRNPEELLRMTSGEVTKGP